MSSAGRHLKIKKWNIIIINIENFIDTKQIFYRKKIFYKWTLLIRDNSSLSI